MKYRVQAGGVDWGKSKDDIAVTTGYRKVDDVLRMVLVSQDWQTEQLTRYLQDKFEQADGGYAIAATAMQRRLRQVMIGQIP